MSSKQSRRDWVKAYRKDCDWDPKKDAPMDATTKGHALATVVAVPGRWLLCESCSKLGRFHHHRLKPIAEAKR